LYIKLCSINQIEEECKKIQVSLREMAASHGNLSDSVDSVFCGESKGDNGDDDHMFVRISLEFFYWWNV
jgi:hypothetical protein